MIVLPCPLTGINKSPFPGPQLICRPAADLQFHFHRLWRQGWRGKRGWTSATRVKITICEDGFSIPSLDLAPIRQGGDAALAFSGNTLDLAQHAERWGYPSLLRLAEHHNIPGIASAATAVVIGHVAGGTRHIRVGSGGHHAAQPLSPGDRRAIWHAGIRSTRAVLISAWAAHRAGDQ